MSRPVRIFIGIAAYHSVSPETLEDYMAFVYHVGRRLPQYEILTGIISKSEQFRARNNMVTGAMQVNADYLLMLDDDMILSPFRTQDAYDFIDRLVKHGKDIVGALYFQRMGNYMPVAMMASGSGYQFLRPDQITEPLQEVDVVGGGAMLVSMKVFDKLGQPWFAPEHEFGTDVQLCRAAKRAGFTVWLDSTIEFGHVRDERIVITSRNRDQYALETNVPGEVVQQMVRTDYANNVLKDVCEWTGFTSMNDLALVGQRFMADENRLGYLATPGATVEGWYQLYPKERVARQCWFNLTVPHKKRMTEFILATVGDQRKVDILDFGCGIGIPAFEFAKRGHRVTACDLDGTGTYEFLKWRAKKHNIDLTFTLSVGAVPLLPVGKKFAAIVAMDVLEHIPEWRRTLAALAYRIETGGLLFCNNGILEDDAHPEHYPLNNKEFIAECMANDLMPVNQILFEKREAKSS